MHHYFGWSLKVLVIQGCWSGLILREVSLVFESVLWILHLKAEICHLQTCLYLVDVDMETLVSFTDMTLMVLLVNEPLSVALVDKTLTSLMSPLCPLFADSTVRVGRVIDFIRKA